MQPSALSKIIKPLASLSLFFKLCGALGVLMLAGTLKPGWDIYHRPWFIGLLGLLALNTLACVSSRWKSVPWPSLVSHFGILSILAGGAASLALGRGGQLPLSSKGPSGSQIWAGEGKAPMQLPFSVKLKEFEIQYHGAGRHELLLSREDGRQEALWVQPGGRYSAIDGHAKIEVLEFNPDFYIDEGRRVARRSEAPRNPALRVSLTASPTRQFWVFQDYPGMHQEGQPIQLQYAYHAPAVKQYQSLVQILDPSGKVLDEQRLWVNKPLRHAGYTLYQASFDPEDPTVSVLSVRKDPGTPLVYFGFLVLVIGLSWNALRRLA